MPAWVARGESFLALGTPLLAGLHFDRALELDPACAAAAQHKENLRRLLSDDSASAPPAAAAAAAGETDSDPRHPPEHPSRPARASKSSIPSTEGAVSGFWEDGREKRVSVADGADVGIPAPAEDRAVFHSDNRNEAGAVAAAAGIASSSRGEGEAAGTGDGTDGTAAAGGCAAAFRRAVAAACENYRAGVVFHQEAFLSSSTERFLRVLELLDVTTAQMATVGAPQGHEGELGNGIGDESAGLSCEPGAGGLAGGGAGVKSSSSRGESFDGGAEVLRSMRVGCHLNIAAAFLLRKTDVESAVDHCTRYATWGGRGATARYLFQQPFARLV